MKKSGNFKTLVAAVGTLTGTVIGAGILGLPYVIAKSGFLIGVIHIVLLGLIMLLINLYIGEISLRTKGNHQLPGYANKYIGKPGKIFMIIMMLFGVYSALIAYLLGIGESLSFVIFGNLNLSLLFLIIVGVIISVIIAFGLKALRKVEGVGIFLIIGTVLVILIFFATKIKVSNLTYINPALMFLPYGVVLFALLGFDIMPEMELVLKGKEKLLKKAIIIGSLIPIAIYIVFVLAVVGFSGLSSPEIATFALGRLPTLLGIFTMFTSLVALSFVLRDMYVFDMKLGKILAWFLVTIVPLIATLLIFIFKAATFTQILGLAGSVTGGLTGILILIMNKKAKKFGNRKPEYELKLPWVLLIILAIMFILGIFYEIYMLFL